MSRKPRILAFAGSTRSGSVNKKLVRVAARVAEAVGAEVTVIDLAEFEMPLYDGDLEEKQGLPENAKKLKQLMRDHDGFLIASPEYNSSISAVLKNCIDWASRAKENEKPLEAFSGKVAAIISASPGALGGLRGLVHLRAILGNIQVLVIPETTSVGNAFEVFNDAGELTDERKREAVERVASRLTEVLAKLVA